MQKADGMNYAPKRKPNPVVDSRKCEFVFSATALEHGHIYGMCNGLIEAGATLKYVYDADPEKVKQFLTYADVKDATIISSKVANYNLPDYPELEDFGDATLLGDNGATQYFRVDWFTPDWLSTWGDGRTIILGTEGYIELRKYVDVGRDPQGDNVYLINQDGEHYINVTGKVGFSFFGQLILDCIHRTENAMTQEHAFKAGKLCVMAQNAAMHIG